MDITSYLLGKQAGGGGGDVSLQTNKSVTITSNGSTTVNPDEGYDAIKKVSVTTNVPFELEAKSLTITENGTTTVTPTQGKDGLSSVEVTTNVPTGADLSEYFNTTINSNTAGTLTERANLLKKFPDVIIGDNVTNISNAFADFYFGTSLPKLIGGTNLTNISALFSNASYNKAIVTQIDISGLITNNVSNMSYMISGQSAITNLDFSNFNTENVTNMSSMFLNCRNLTSLNLSSFNTSKVTNMTTMFGYCTKLTELDIRNFDFTRVTSSNNMFLDVPSNCLIIVKDDTAKNWITSKWSNLTNVKTVAEL